MRYEFAKLHGAGNDFIMIDDADDRIELAPDVVARACDRHFGVGADGIIVVKPSPRAECAAYMDYYNSDGTKAEMCGNGIRCFAKFLVDRGIVDGAAGRFVADTLSGPHEISFELDEQGKLTRATVDMGEPILDPAEVPTTLRDENDETRPVTDALLSAGDALYHVTCVSMGNPHAIVFVDDPLEYPVGKVGPLIEKACEFPEYTNVEFARCDGDTIVMRVWERGCGETLACGTGSCATAVAANLTGRAPRKVHVNVLGGVLDINWADDNHVYMTGPAQQSYTGSFEA